MRLLIADVCVLAKMSTDIVEETPEIMSFQEKHLRDKIFQLKFNLHLMHKRNS